MALRFTALLLTVAPLLVGAGIAIADPVVFNATDGVETGQRPILLAQAFELQGASRQSANAPISSAALAMSEEQWRRDRQEKARAARRAAIEARLDREEEDKRRLSEFQIAEQKRQAEIQEKTRLAQQEEERRRLVDAQAAEQRRIAEAQAAEQKRQADEKARLAKEEEDRRKLAEAQAAEQKRIAEQQAVAEREKVRIAKEEEAKRKLADAQAAEQKRQAELREKIRLAKEEEDRRKLAEAQAAEQKRQVELQAAEQKRMAEQQAAEQRERARLAQEEEAKRKLAEAQAAEQQRLTQLAAAVEQKRVAEAQAAELKRQADQQAEEQKRRAEQVRLALLNSTPPPAAPPTSTSGSGTGTDAVSGLAADEASRFTAEQRRLAKERLERQRKPLEEDPTASVLDSNPTGDGAPKETNPKLAARIPENGEPLGKIESEPPKPADQPETVKSVQTELKRLGCYTGAISGNLNKNTAAGLENAQQHLGANARSLRPVTEDTLLILREKQGKLCDLQEQCGAGQVRKNGTCIASRPSRDEEDEEPVRRPRRQTQPQPRREIARPAAPAAPAPAPAAPAGPARRPNVNISM